jgi:hypothetical protein
MSAGTKNINSLPLHFYRPIPLPTQ